jgi:hypothetical protein
MNQKFLLLFHGSRRSKLIALYCIPCVIVSYPSGPRQDSWSTVLFIRDVNGTELRIDTRHPYIDKVSFYGFRVVKFISLKRCLFSLFTFKMFIFKYK